LRQRLQFGLGAAARLALRQVLHSLRRQRAVVKDGGIQLFWSKVAHGSAFFNTVRIHYLMCLLDLGISLY
jgi:hypothetical protein